jgi:Phage integrase family
MPDRFATAVWLNPAAMRRHGLRASEVCGLRWDQIDLNSGRLHVRRAKGGIDNVHPLSGKEIRALRQLRRENMETRYVFITERGGPATTAGFLKMIARTGEAAKLPFPVHPHMLRHSTGYKLANDGHDTRALQHYMGIKISCTRFATPKWRLIGSRISGRTEARTVRTHRAPRHGSTSCNLLAAVDGCDVVDSGGHSESYEGVNVKPSSI